MRNILGYQALFILGPLLGILNLKILTNNLSISQFSTLQLLIPLLEWVVLIGVVGAPQFILRFWSRLELFEKIDIARFCFLSIFLLAIASFFIIIPYLSLNIPVNVIILMVLICLLQGGFKYSLSITRAQLKHQTYLGLALLQKIILTSSLLISSAYIIFSIEIYFYVLFFAFAVPLLFFLYFTKTKLKSITGRLKSVELNIPKELFNYGIPIVGVMFLGDLLITGNRYVLNYNGLYEFIGVYSIYMFVCTIAFQVLTEPVVSYFHPILFKLYDETKEKFEVIFSTMSVLLIMLAIYMSIHIIKYEDFIINLIANDQYKYSDENFIIIVVLGGFFCSLYRIFSTLYYVEKNTHRLSILVAISLVVSLLLALLLVQELSLLGVAIAYALSQFLLAGYLIINCLCKINFYLDTKMILVFFATLLISIIFSKNFTFDVIYFSIFVDFFIGGLLALFLINRLMIKIKECNISKKIF
jgi:O-antigen/teichoic acid export membrane protein